MPGAKTSIIMDVPPKKIYDVVIDFENYPDFLPDVKKAVVKKTGKDLVASFEISVIKTIHYTLRFHGIPAKKVVWSFVEGDIFKDNRGEWLFEPEGKNKTHVTYKIEVDFGLFVPSMITNKLVGKSLPAMMEKFKKRAESL